MQTEATFEILFRKKIPYWTTLLIGVLAACSIFLFLLYLVMLPSENAGSEMRVVYYILAVPNWLKDASAYSFIGIILIYPIYKLSRRFVPAMLVIKEGQFNLLGAGMDKVIPIDSISKILLNEVNHIVRKPKETLEVIIKQGEWKKTSFLLKHSVQADEFAKLLMSYPALNLNFYDDNVSFVQLDDEE